MSGMGGIRNRSGVVPTFDTVHRTQCSRTQHTGTLPVDPPKLHLRHVARASSPYM